MKHVLTNYASMVIYILCDNIGCGFTTHVDKVIIKIL